MPKFEPACWANPGCANFPRTANFGDILAVLPLGSPVAGQEIAAPPLLLERFLGKVRFSIPEASSGRIFVAPAKIMYDYLGPRAIMSDL